MFDGALLSVALSTLRLLLPLGVALYVHRYWLPRHGVNGWTGEPRERYLALVARKRGKAST